MIKAASLVPRPSIIANTFGRPAKTPTWNDIRWTFEGHLKAWYPVNRLQTSTSIIPCRSFTRPSTALAVIEGLGMRLDKLY